jgi:hypothetical protein
MMRSPSEPIWRGDHEAWKRDITVFGEPHLPVDQPTTHHGRAIAIAVFYRAANWNTLFLAPLDLQIWAWARVLDLDWLSVDLAERAVDKHFEAEVLGWMMPFDVIANATYLLLEEGGSYA